MKIREIFRSRVGRVSVLVLVSGFLGLLVAFRNVPLPKQLELVSALFTIAPVVFAILGVWIAVLDPSLVLNQNPSDKPNQRTSLALEFSPLLVIATFVFVGVIIMRFAGPLLPESWFENFWGTMVLGTIISSLYAMEIYVLIMTLLPVARVHKKSREDSLRRRYRN